MTRIFGVNDLSHRAAVRPVKVNGHSYTAVGRLREAISATEQAVVEPREAAAGPARIAVNRGTEVP